MKVLVIDNYDSFTYNLVQYLGELGMHLPGADANGDPEPGERQAEGEPRPGPRGAEANGGSRASAVEIDVVRNDRATVAELLARRPDRLVISPGPCTPADAGISIEAARAFPDAGIPTLGVCLGHQAMVDAFGGRTIRGEPVHGKGAEVTHDGRGVFRGLESPLRVGRYHSLVADPDLPDELELTATFEDVVMGVRHRSLPAEGVQFHPESVLTPGGKDLLRNFLVPAA